jgi:tyrosine-protein kinase Etk/Wzc
MNLAASFAGGYGEKVLLIDGNTERADISRMLALPEEGLTELLRGRVSLEDVAVRTHVSGLWGLSVGKSSRRIERLLTPKSLDSLLDGLRRRFTRIIIELPTSYDTPEGPSLVSRGDALLVPVMKSRTRKQEVRRFMSAVKPSSAAKVQWVFVDV